MAHFDLSERGGRQGHWRRRQHRWSGPDNFHNDSRSAISHGYESHRGGSRPLRADSHTVVLDELTLRHMAQDCSSVKSQLLKLKSLLQLDDSGAIQDTEDSSEDNSTSSQLEDLMREVADLREELRNKDKIIANLKHKQVQQQQQSPVRCQCQQRSPAVRGERRAQHDKATQTPWRGHAAMLPVPLLSHWQCQYQGPPRASMPQRQQTSNTTALHPHPQRAPHPGKTSKTGPHRGPQ